MNKQEYIRKNIRDYLSAWKGSLSFSEYLSSNNETSIYLTGGAVRNAILNIETEPRDFDFIIETENKDKLLRYLSLSGILTKGQYGALRWYPNCSTRYCDLIFNENFSNNGIKCHNKVDILNQFDFTGNAIAIDLNSFEILDPVGGISDLNNRIIKFVKYNIPNFIINKKSQLTNWAVIWFRAIYFTEKYSFRIEDNTFQWLLEHSYLAEQMSLFNSNFFMIDEKIKNNFLSVLARFP